MKVALYRGIGLVSTLIKFITRSKYSHAAFLFDAESHRVATMMQRTGASLGKLKYWNDGAVVEAWKGGVKNSMSLSTLHDPNTPVDIFAPVKLLTTMEEQALISFCASIIGWPYSYLNVIRFLTKTPGKQDGSYFCSEAVFEGWRTSVRPLLNNCKDWEVEPHWLALSTELEFVRTIWTNK